MKVSIAGMIAYASKNIKRINKGWKDVVILGTCIQKNKCILVIRFKGMVDSQLLEAEALTPEYEKFWVNRSKKTNMVNNW